MEDIAEDSPIKIVPKLTIKMDGSATDSPFYVDKSPRSEQKIPKITLKTGTDHAIIITHNQLNQLPKITIKTKSVDSSVETNMHGSPNKLMARQINDPVNEERVPKIMISRDKTGDVLEKVEAMIQKKAADMETIEILSSSSNCSSDVKIAEPGVDGETIIEVEDNEEEENGLDNYENEKMDEEPEKPEAIVIVEDEKLVVAAPINDVDELPMDIPKVRRRGRPRKQVFEGKETPKKTDDKVRVFPVDDDSSQKPEEETKVNATPSPQKLNRSYRGRGRGRGRGGRGTPVTPRIRTGGLKHSPNIERVKAFVKRETPAKGKETSLQVFEEDTQMDPLDITDKDIKDVSYLNNEDTQNSISSNTSNTVKKKYRSKLDVIVPESTNYGPSNIAEYDWPPPKGCCPAKNRETYMIQEQIAIYLGITSFKRKYPDLPRRTIDHEERNWLQEKQLVTEKMCDLGLTAVFASDILDIMYCDFYDKYEQYKNYLRQKTILDRDSRKPYDPARGLPLKKKSVLSVSEWNAQFNKSRKAERQACFDLQNLVEHVRRPDLYKKITAPSNPSHYPISIVPGQFCDNYRTISPEELKYYPLNTSKIMNSNTRFNNVNKRPADSGSDCESSAEDSSSASSSDGEDEEDGDGEPETAAPCAVCHKPQSHNKIEMPEVFIKCYTCKRTVHPSCIEMTTRMFKRCKSYNWQCSDCKCCVKCKNNAQRKSKMLFCEQCDRGYHIYCLKYKSVPDSRWSCEKCTICMNCGASTPNGYGGPAASSKKVRHKKVKWINDYSFDHITKLREHSVILCVQCGRNNNANRKLYTNHTSPVVVGGGHGCGYEESNK